MATRAEASIWTERKARWYLRATARGDYADRVLEAIAPLLAAARTALDVGAGFGALSLPLARRLDRVTALEPAPAMTALLREEADRLGIGNVVLLEQAWEAAAVEPHDLVLCAHVGDLLQPDSSLLRALPTLARRGAALVVDARPDRDKFFFRELYPMLLGRPYRERCGRYLDLLGWLDRQGILANITQIRYRSDQPFGDLEEACDFWQEYLGLPGEPVREFLRGYLAERLTREGGEWIAPLRKEAAVIWWRTDGGAGR